MIKYLISLTFLALALPSLASAAIVKDTSVESHCWPGVSCPTPSTIDVNITVTSTANSIVFALFQIDSGYSGLQMLYNGVGMTQIKADTVNNPNLYIFYTLNASGTHALHASWTGTKNADLIGASYAGVDPNIAWSGGSQTDNVATSSAGSNTSYSQSLSTLQDNSWAIWIVRDNSGNTLTGDANTTQIQQFATFGTSAWDNSGHGAITPAGSYTFTATHANSSNQSIMATFSPAGGAPPPVVSKRKIRGVGITR